MFFLVSGNKTSINQSNVSASLLTSFKLAKVFSATEHKRINCTRIRCGIVTYACMKEGSMNYILQSISWRTDMKQLPFIIICYQTRDMLLQLPLTCIIHFLWKCKKEVVIHKVIHIVIHTVVVSQLATDIKEHY